MGGVPHPVLFQIWGTRSCPVSDGGDMPSFPGWGIPHPLLQWGPHPLLDRVPHPVRVPIQEGHMTSGSIMGWRSGTGSMD